MTAKTSKEVLYDPDEMLAQPWYPSSKTTTSAQAREWAFLAWLDLTDAAKYLALIYLTNQLILK